MNKNIVIFFVFCLLFIILILWLSFKERQSSENESKIKELLNTENKEYIIPANLTFEN